MEDVMEEFMTNEKWKQLFSLLNEAWLDAHYAGRIDEEDIFGLAGRWSNSHVEETE